MGWKTLYIYGKCKFSCWKCSGINVLLWFVILFHSQHCQPGMPVGRRRLHSFRFSRWAINRSEGRSRSDKRTDIHNSHAKLESNTDYGRSPRRRGHWSLDRKRDASKRTKDFRVRFGSVTCNAPYRGVLQKKLCFETYPPVGTFGEVGMFTWFFMM